MILDSGLLFLGHPVYEPETQVTTMPANFHAVTRASPKR